MIRKCRDDLNIHSYVASGFGFRGSLNSKNIIVVKEQTLYIVLDKTLPKCFLSIFNYFAANSSRYIK